MFNEILYDLLELLPLSKVRELIYYIIYVLEKDA